MNMTIIQDIYNKLMDCCSQFSSSFTTADVIESFSQRYQQDWNDIQRRFGEGGEGNGRYYTSNVYVGQMLWRLSKKGRIQFVEFQDAPRGWGNPVIALYHQ